MQRGGDRRRHPGGIGAGLEMLDLGLHHRVQLVRHRPHPLADLGPPHEPAIQPGPHIGGLISLQPGGLFQFLLGRDRAGLHAGVNIIAGAVQKAGIDKHQALPDPRDTGREVHRGAAFLVHNADLEGMSAKPQRVFHPQKQLIGQRHLLRAVQLGLDDIDRARAAVAVAAIAQDIMFGRERRHHRVQHGFRDRPAGLKHGRGVEVRADIARQHQAAARQGHCLAVWPDIIAIRGHGALHGLAVFFNRARQIAAHQPQPVAINGELVGAIHRGDRVLAVHDRGDCGFNMNIVNPGVIPPANKITGAEAQLHMQAVMTQHDRIRAGRIARVAHKLLRL